MSASVSQNFAQEDVAYADANDFRRLIGDYTDRRAPLAADASVDEQNKTPLPADIGDLCRLHRLVRSRKVTTVLEFGVGFSSVVLADAMRRNRDEFAERIEASTLRRNNPFEVHSLDANAEFSALWRDRTAREFEGLLHFHESACHMGKFQGRICHFYDSLPDICPDFIYLDAPSQWDVEGDVRGVSTRHKDRVPIAADLLAIEYFLLPGTLILVDGRGMNARFLRDHFKRNWHYRHDRDGDVHLFELVEPPIGDRNRAQLLFCLGQEWLSNAENIT